MAGKDKLTAGVRLSWDDSAGTARDLSGDLIAESLSGLGFTRGEVDMTGASDGAKNFRGDQKDMSITAQLHANDTATTGASTVLNASIGSVGTLTIQVGAGGAAPTTGDLELEGEFVLLGAPLVPQGGKLVHQCTWRPGASTAPSWGTVS